MRRLSNVSLVAPGIGWTLAFATTALAIAGPRNSMPEIVKVENARVSARQRGDHVALSKIVSADLFEIGGEMT